MVLRTSHFSSSSYQRLYIRSRLLFFTLEYGIGDQCSSVHSKLKRKVTDFLHQTIKRKMKEFQLLLQDKTSSVHDMQIMSRFLSTILVVIASKIIGIGCASKAYLNENASDQNPFLGPVEEFLSNVATARAEVYVTEYKGYDISKILKSFQENSTYEDKIGKIVCDLTTQLVVLGFIKIPTCDVGECYWKYFSLR